MAVSNRYLLPAQPGLFDAMDRLEQLDAMGDPLAKLDAVIDWSVFDPVLAQLPKADPKGPGGRPGFPPSLMFKVLVIQFLYGLSDEQAQFQILDRRSFHRFLAFNDADHVPDQSTIHAFREAITRAGLAEALFDAFGKELHSRGFITRKGQIVDAAFIEVPRQRNTRAQNETIKAGGVPEEWKGEAKKLSHKDMDARWAKKREVLHYGYKDHIVADAESKLITRAVVTDASVHDSQALESLVQLGDPPTWADSAYSGEPCQQVFARKGVAASVCAKGARGNALAKRQKRSNLAKSRIRSRVEHIFGFMTGSMGALMRRCIGMVRHTAAAHLANLVYNLARTEQIIRLKLMPARPVLK